MSGDEPHEEPGALDAREVLDRVQELVDDRPIAGPCPLEWAVPAYYLGDVGALAMLSLRELNAQDED